VQNQKCNNENNQHICTACMGPPHSRAVTAPSWITTRKSTQRQPIVISSRHLVRYDGQWSHWSDRHGSLVATTTDGRRDSIQHGIETAQCSNSATSWSRMTIVLRVHAGVDGGSLARSCISTGWYTASSPCTSHGVVVPAKWRQRSISGSEAAAECLVILRCRRKHRIFEV
jgi:hypothetical protein